jgi:plastocyanin
MNRHTFRWRAAIATAGVVAAAGLAYAGFAAGDTAYVSLTSTGPSPSQVTVNWGDTVNFANHDGATHTVASASQTFNPGALSPGATYSYAFTGRKGNYSYTDHTSKHVFRGSIIVQLNGAITIGGSRSSIPYGHSVVLSGHTNILIAPATISTHVKGQKGWVEAYTVTPDGTTGAYSVTAKPRQSAEYYANTADNQVKSNPITVDVRPVLKVTALTHSAPTGHLVKLRIKVTPSESVTAINIERFSGGVWVSAGVAKASPSGVTIAAFRAVRGPTLYRVHLKAPGLLVQWGSTTSRAVRITGIGGPSRRHH